MMSKHKQHRLLSKLILFSTLLGIGFSMGIAQTDLSVNATTRDELENPTNMSKSTIPTNDQTEGEFEDQIKQPVDLNKPINVIFKDKVLQNSVAKSLNVDITQKLTDSTDFTHDKVRLFIYPVDNQADNPYLINDWTGMAALKNRLMSITLNDQGDNFNSKVLKLTDPKAGFLSDKANDVDTTGLYLNFDGDGITQDTFEALMTDLTNVSVDKLNLDSNYIHDFKTLDALKFSGDSDDSDVPFHNLFLASNQFGAAEGQPTHKLIVSKDGTLNLTYLDMEGLDNMPSPPLSPKGTSYNNMFDTINSRSVYHLTSGENTFEDALTTPVDNAGLTLEAIANGTPTNVTTPQLTDYLNDYLSNTRNIEEHLWDRIGIFDSSGKITRGEHAQASVDMIYGMLPMLNKNAGTHVTPDDITAKANSDGVTVSNIPQKASSITMRTDYNAAGSGGLTTHYGNTIDIPISHESEGSSSNGANGGHTDPATSSTPSSEANHVSSTDHQKPTAPAVKKGQAVYAIQKVKLHKTATFSRHSTKYTYAKQSRTKRPQFVVLGYAHSKSGLLRYRVRDVNHHSKSDGKIGYLTGNTKFVVNTYYQVNPKKIQVINPKGINAYHNIKLNGKVVKHYRRGTALKIKRIKSHHLTTRLQLSNGTWITANKTLIIKK